MTKRRSLGAGLALAGLLGAAGAVRVQEPSAALDTLIEEVWAFRLKEDPLLATRAGEHRYDDRLPSVAPEDQSRRASFARDALEKLEAIDRSVLEGQDAINYDMLERELGEEVRAYELRHHLIPITVDTGFHIGLARLPDLVRLATAEDYENYISRLREVPRYFEEHIGLMREGLRTGMTLPRVVLEGYEATISAHVVGEPEESLFYRPFEEFPTAVRPAERERLAASGREAVMDAVVPAYRSFLDFMTGEYIPGARSTTGASELPNGREYYQYLIGHFTTLDVTAEEVHRIGLSEVERIRGEMEAIIREVGFSGDFAAFLEFLRTDPRFYPKTPEELLEKASYIAKRMDGRLPALFRTLPRQPYGIEPVPDHLAPKYTAGRYVGAPLSARRGGYYWVNTYKLDSRTLYTLEALTLHEAVPGHHLQNALSQELEDLPPFRRFTNLSAFGEGWGLYAERLGLEAGFYTDPYSNFGRLTYEMWRACRLVVDTGIHAMGWSRSRAMDFMAERTALSLHEIQTETDRYISWPGQALAYKLGELEIRRLRERAETELGDRFDVREFHDVVLRNGEIPLPVLAREIASYIESKRSSSDAR